MRTSQHYALILVGLLCFSPLCSGAEPSTSGPVPPTSPATVSEPVQPAASSTSSVAAPTPAAEPKAVKVHGPNDPQSTWERVDTSLDSALAATLAGLAAAVATFLLAASAPLASDIAKIKDLGGSANKEQQARLLKLKNTVNDLLLSFYFFVGMIVESLTLDHWEAPGALLSEQTWAPYADVSIGGALLGAGLYYLGSGTRALRDLLLEDLASGESK